MSFKNILCFGTLNPDLIYFVDELPNKGDDIRSLKSSIRPGGTAINCSELISLWDKSVHVRGNSIGSDPMGKYLVDYLKVITHFFYFQLKQHFFEIFPLTLPF